jgi:hypothetical protein
MEYTEDQQRIIPTLWALESLKTKVTPEEKGHIMYALDLLASAYGFMDGDK